MLKNIKNSTIVALFLYVTLYFPHIFILNEDVNLLLSYEVDPGSIFYAIEDLFRAPYYNMMNGYHSRYYGWSYLSINFVLLAPIKIWSTVFSIKPIVLNLLVVKLILFLIGFLVIYHGSKLVEILSKGCVEQYFFKVLVVLLPTYFYYYIHPETTGILFILISYLLLHSFLNTNNVKYLYWGFSSLVVASLSKQVFVVPSGVVLIAYLVAYHRVGLQNMVKSLPFYGNALLIIMGTAFVIHPYAFIQFHTFIEHQQYLAISLTGQDALSFFASFSQWFIVVKDSFGGYFYIIGLITSPIIFLYYSHLLCKNFNFKNLFFITNSAAIVISFLFLAYGNRISFLTHYLFIIYFLSTINLLAIYELPIFKIPTRAGMVLRYLSCYFIGILCIYLLSIDVIQSINRLSYKNSAAYVSYNYIRKNIKSEDVVLHDFTIAVPTALSHTSCHFWRECATIDGIVAKNPNYVIYNKNMSNKINPDKFEMMFKFIKENNFKLVAEIPFYENISNSFDLEENTLFVYKK